MKSILCSRHQIVVLVCVVTSLWLLWCVVVSSHKDTPVSLSFSYISNIIYGQRHDKNKSTQTINYFMSNNNKDDSNHVVDSSHYSSEFLASNVEVRGRYVLVGLKKPFIERIQFYNHVISVYRNGTLDKLKASAQQQQQQWPVRATTVYADVDNFLFLLATDSHVAVQDSLTTVYLTYIRPPLTLNASDLERQWDSRSAEMSVNLLVQNYYDWAGPAPLCQSIYHEERYM